jgi:trk system potassium uptake protein TrkH
MRPHVIFRYMGFIFLFNAVFLFISALISIFYSDSACLPLLYSTLIASVFGVFPLIYVPPTTDITNKEGFIIIVSSWMISCLVGMMPYILWGGEFTLTNAWFESVSGYTTTGSSILTNVEALPLGLLFWRAATHWIGGIGIIIFALSVLPSLGRAGMILYRAEISALAMENFHYRTKKTLQILAIVYVGLTLAETIGLLFCGMNWFDAVTHAFATIATGGFSPKNTSIAHYQNFSIEIVIMVFMVLSGLHFGLLFAAFQRRASGLWKSSVVRTYFIALACGVAFITLSVHGAPFFTWAESLRYSAFQLISLGTSTGFATIDTTLWPPFAQLVMIFFTLQCACAGSTSGGIKVDRIVIFWKGFLARIAKTRHPHGVFTPKIDGVVIDNDLLEASFLYITVYIGIVFISCLILTALGVDMLSAFSASAATMGNVGPGFGMVGSMSNFSQIPDPGKWLLTLTMLLGRLEIFGLILFVTAKSWK